MTGGGKSELTRKDTKRKTGTNAPDGDDHVEMENDSTKIRKLESADDIKASTDKIHTKTDKGKKDKSIEKNSVNLGSKDKDGLMHGKPFSKGEDEKIEQAVHDYIEKHKLGDEGLQMISNCHKFPEVKGCWREIAQALPHRPYESVYKRARVFLGINQDGLVHGKRFSKEEDKIIEEAVYDYIEKYQLGEEGLQMILNCGKIPEIKRCWREIAQALPHRPYESVYNRGRIILETNRKGEWTKEEYDRIIEFQKQHGNNWKELAAELGKCRIHVKDKWRRIKLPDRKSGGWTQEEYQKLFELVNLDMKLKISEEKRSQYGMLRDNIAWGAISDKMASRENSVCCHKWYGQLTSSMVSAGNWSDGDDYRLIDELFKLDACCVEDVDWDSLLSHRTGDLCKKRWEQMVLHIGENGRKSFGEQVDILSKRYCPDLVDVRDAWDKKPLV